MKIITGDRDLLQLVTPRVVVSLPTQKLSDSEDYFPEDVVRKLGVTPEQVVDYKALVGDTSDNIPGVKGIGEKTAITLLAEYQTLDGIYEHIDQIKGRAQTALMADKENAYMSQDLARIVTDLDVKLDLDQARPNRFDPAEVEKLFRELEFRTLMQRLGTVVKKLKPVTGTGQQMALFGDAVAPDVKESSTTGITTHIVDSKEKMNKCINVLNKAKMIAFDTETTSTNAMQAGLVGISLAVSQDEGYYIPIGHLSGKQLNLIEVISALKAPLSDPKIAKIAHNAKFDMLILERVGLPVTPVTFDTMIAEWLINPDSRNLGLKNMAWVKLGYEMTHIEALIGTGRSQITMEAVPITQAASYAVADAVVTLRLHGMLQKELEQVNAIELFNTVEMPLIPILAQMEMNGVALDKNFLENFGKELETSLHDIEYKIYGLVGEPFNINSTQQLSDVLFKRLGLEPPDRSRKTTSGFLSTAAGVLEDMRGQHEVVDLILEYREIAKLKSTYVDSLPLQVNPNTGRIHTSFNQTGTVTGRVASSDPNLQNIPTRSELGRKVRFGFIAEPGNLLLAVDYSQIELRIVSHMAQDEAMMDAFRNGQDIHATTAAAIFDVPLDKVTKDQRRHAKAINFGLIYGMSPYGLTRSTDLTLAEAENFVKAYFARFPGVKAYLDGTRKTATERGYVETLLGRRRYFPNLKSGTNFNLRQREEREAINAPIQGTAADIIKLAMLKLPTRLKEAGLGAKLLLQVHDELILEVPKAELPKTAALVKQVMENAYALSIPVTTDARSGASWGELEPVEE